MADQFERLCQFFVRKDVDLSDNEGDDNTSGEYWEVKDPEHLKSWSIALVPITENVNFVMKFFAVPYTLPISTDKRIKEVVHFKDNILHIHCQTMDVDPYSFTIVLNNSCTSPFTVVPFLSSLEGSSYEPLMKEIKADIHKKSSVTKEGLPLRACSISLNLRSLIMSMATMTTSHKVVA